MLIFILPVGSPAADYCFEEAGETYGVAPELLWAISKVESTFNNKAVNWNKNGSYDFCHMQINSGWYRTLGRDLWMQLGDPCTCTKVGAWVLANCVRNYGYTWKAVGCYNAVSQDKRSKYAWKVFNVIKKYSAQSEGDEGKHAGGRNKQYQDSASYKAMEGQSEDP